MSKINNSVHFILLTLAMLMISTSGPLGKYLTMSPPLAIWYRAIIAFVLLYIALRFKGEKISYRGRGKFGRLLLISILMTTHLITYFFALQYSNVAIGMLTLFTYPTLTALLEPLFIKKKLDLVHIVFGIFLLLGIYLLAPSFDPEDKIFLGVVCGLVSALAYAIRNILLKKLASQHSGLSLMTVQTFFISLLLIPIALSFSHEALHTDWWALLMLGIVTTAMGHSLFIHTFRFFSISKVSILSSMQPLLGIILALIFLREIPSVQTIFGGAIILSLVIIEGRRKELS